MNILFLLKTLGVGGVEVVSVTLANKFVDEGHKVVVFARADREKNLQSKLNPEIKVYIGCGDNDCSENVEMLHDVYVKEDINVVINQWGLPYKPIRLARKAEKGHHVKIISFHHNDPAANGRLILVDRLLKGCGSRLKKWELLIKRFLYYFVTSSSMKYTYRHSDKFMVLSNKYLKNLQQFIRVPFEKKQGVLTNPVTIDSEGFVYSSHLKKKEIIFCGRMDDVQKCPRRVLDVWELLLKEFPDWTLRFIGDGPDRLSVEKEAHRRELSNVFFEGFQNPTEYYKRASILVMTSEFEGFPLVLAESMSFGVVPCVYNSFDALEDILNDGVNGIVVEKENGGWNAKRMAEKISRMLSDPEKMSSMALSAIKSSQYYSIDSVYKQWNILLKELVE